MPAPIEISLGGETFVLRPSLRAAQFLSSRGSDGLEGVAQRCDRLDFQTIQDVIEAGIDDTFKKLPELIYEEGLITLSPACVEYVKRLSNGGNPIEEVDEKSTSNSN